MPNLTRRTTTPHLRWTSACVSTGYHVTSMGSDLLMLIPMLATYTCTPCATVHFSPLCWRLGVTQQQPQQQQVPRGVWVASCSWTVGIQEGFERSRWLHWQMCVPEALGCVVLGSDSTVSLLQEDQVQLKNLRTESKWWSNPPTRRVTAEANAEDFLLPALHVHCWLCNHVRLSVVELFKHSRETGICGHILLLVQSLYWFIMIRGASLVLIMSTFLFFLLLHISMAAFPRDACWVTH